MNTGEMIWRYFLSDFWWEIFPTIQTVFLSSTFIGCRSASSHLTNRCDRLLQRRAFPVKTANQEELTGEMWQQSNSKHDVRHHWWSPCQSQSATIWALSLSHFKCCDKNGEEEQTLAPPSGQLFISCLKKKSHGIKHSNSDFLIRLKYKRVLNTAWRYCRPWTFYLHLHVFVLLDFVIFDSRGNGRILRFKKWKLSGVFQVIVKVQEGVFSTQTSVQMNDKKYEFRRKSTQTDLHRGSFFFCRLLRRLLLLVSSRLSGRSLQHGDHLRGVRGFVCADIVKF